jgi:hypothetical protein
MIKKILGLTIFCISLFSCEEKNESTTQGETIELDSLENNVVEQFIPTSETISEDKLPEAVKKIVNDEDMKETKVALEKKHGVQWDFCTCVIKSDSILTAFNSVKDENLDQLMERSDFIDSKCSMIRATPNTTPSEREKHEKAINACRKAFKER